MFVAITIKESQTIHYKIIQNPTNAHLFILHVSEQPLQSLLWFIYVARRQYISISEWSGVSFLNES